MASDGNYTGWPDPDDDDLAFYAKNGYYIYISDYILRPEVLESNFYAWRVTGDTKYLDRAAKAIDSFNKYLPGNVAFDGIEDVNGVASEKEDDMESFWFAEVLKYLYAAPPTSFRRPVTIFEQVLDFRRPQTHQHRRL